MLHNTSTSNKYNDRFISTRSAERDKRTETYKLQDTTNVDYYTQLRSPSSARKPKTNSRTPRILNDENIYEKKHIFITFKDAIIWAFPEKSVEKSIERGWKSSHTANKPLFENSNNWKPIKLSISTEQNQKPKQKLAVNLEKKCFNKIAELQNSWINIDYTEFEPSWHYLRNKHISNHAYKILDAPSLQDDFYLHLLDWSKQNVVAVGWDKMIYWWNGTTMQVCQLGTCILPINENNTSINFSEYYTSWAWINDGSKLISGMKGGFVDVWDAVKMQKLESCKVSTERISTIAPGNLDSNIFSIGTQEKAIKTFDLRVLTKEIMVMNGHHQEVCGLKWSHDDRRLASGGNDNKLIIWNINRADYEHKFTEHTSAVKAIDWSPRQYGYLLTGGGTQDCSWKLWNINTMNWLDSVDTGSQVCNVAYSKNSAEFVTTHGYSDNYILVWDSEKRDVKAMLKGHKRRVIYMACSPDSQKIVTGAGDETIRFWEVFNQERNKTTRVKDNIPKKHQDNFKKVVKGKRKENDLALDIITQPEIR